MDEETRLKLLRLSSQFYEHSGASFDATRHSPWPGWRQLLGRIQSLWEGNEPLRVLDAGCGNGRFASFLAAEVDRPLNYLGVDSSSTLLEAARERGAAEDGRDLLQFEQAELQQWAAESAQDSGTFDLVVLFGVMHHIPSRRRRRALLEDLACTLRSGGLLVATWWMLHRSAHFEKKRAPWSAAPSIDPTRLEAGDHLLSWRGDSSVPRYCHFPADRELDELETLAGLRLDSHFLADGPDGQNNLYRIYRAEPDDRLS